MLTPPHLSEKETLQALQMFTLARSFLRLDQWDLIILLEPPADEDVLMEVTPCDNHHTARISIEADYSTRNPSTVLTDTFVHELVHLMHRDVSDLFSDITFGNDEISKAECNDWFGQFHRHMERMVSHVTKLLVDGWDQQWPPPPKTKVGRGIFVQGEHR